MPRKRGAVVPLSVSIQPRDIPPTRPPNERQQSQFVLGTMKVFGSSLGPLYNLWERLQVSHCGQYSVERMLALEEYGQRVSPLRVAMVCILTPLSPLLLVVLSGYFPLRPSAEGPDANYMFWIRHTIVVAMTSLSGLMQAKAWLSELDLTTLRIFGISLCSSAVTTAFLVWMAKLWVFPLPFMNMLQSPVVIILCFCITGLVLGRGALRDVPDVNFRMHRYFMLITAQGALITIYPAYQALFHAAPNFLQPHLMALLTLVNIAMKNILAACGAHLEDRLPEVIVFTVDVFNTLYSALCMRSTNSLKMAMIVVVLNVADMMLALHGMNQRSRVALAHRAVQQRKHRQQILSAKALGTEPSGEEEDSLGTLFQAALRLLQLPGQLDPAELRQICLLSCAEHNVAEENKTLLAALAARCVYNNDRRPTVLRSMAERKSRYSSTAMSGPDLSAEHFSKALKPPSQFMQRLREAVMLIPEAGKRFSVQIGTRLGNSLGFRVESRDRLSQQKGTEIEESDSDSFDNESTPNDVTQFTANSSRRASHHTGPSTPPQIEPFSNRVSGPMDTSRRTSQVEAFSRRVSVQGGSSRRISTQMGSSSSRRVSVQMGPSRRGSAQMDPSIAKQNGSTRRLMTHLGSSRRLAELTAVSTKLATSLKLRPLLMPENPVINDILKETRKQNTVAVNQTLQLLFNNEYLGLIAYAQCITPTMYMAYMLIMQQMPNRVYYLRDHDFDHPERLAQRYTVIAVFVGLQTGILVGLHIFVANRFGVSTLYQVAFVLETHARLVQSKIATWLLFAVGFMLEHYGVDFSFHFAWIKH